MKSKIKKILSMIIILCCIATTFVGCGFENCSVTIGFKTTDGAAEYQESIDAFEIGKTFYTCVKVKVATDDKDEKEYKVKIEVPKTKDIEVDQTGGLEPINDPKPDGDKTTLEFKIKGSKNSLEEKILFKGVPYGEGNAKITVTIYDGDDNKIYSNFRKVEFKYELQ